MTKLNVIIDSVIKKDEIGLFCDGLGDCLRAVLRQQGQKTLTMSISNKKYFVLLKKKKNVKITSNDK